MTLQNVRIQDPILTQLAQGYHNPELVCETLFPVVEIEKEAGKVPVFGRLAFRQTTTVREVHGNSNRLKPEYVESVPVQLEEHDIEYPIDYREASEASYPLKQHALSVVQDVIALGREIEVAELAQNADNYTEGNSLTIAKSELVKPKTNPLAMIDTAMETVAGTIGRKPNVCVISSDVWGIMKQNEALLDRIKYTRTGILTPDIFAELIGVKKVKIGEAVQEKENTLVKIWQGCIILAYVPETKTGSSIYEPSYGYTVRRQSGLFVDTYQENGGKIEIVRCTDIHKPHLLGKSAGYLIKVIS